MAAKIARVKGLRLIDLFLTKYIQFSTVFFFLFLKFFSIHQNWRRKRSNILGKAWQNTVKWSCFVVVSSKNRLSIY